MIITFYFLLNFYSQVQIAAWDDDAWPFLGLWVYYDFSTLNLRI